MAVVPWAGLEFMALQLFIIPAMSHSGVAAKAVFYCLALVFHALLRWTLSSVFPFFVVKLVAVFTLLF